MNRYGQMAWQHWTTYLPNRLAQLQDPETFFADLGEQADEEIEELATSLERQHAEQDPPGDSYLTRARQLSNARMTAESTVLRQLVLLDPETEDSQQDPDS